MQQLDRILVHVDTDTNRHPGLEAALKLAQKSGATTLDLAATIDDIPWIVNTIFSNQAEAFLQEITEEKRIRLSQIIASHNFANLNVETEILKGKPFIELIRLAIKRNAALLIKDCNPTGENNPYSVDSSDLRLLRKCPCPVWLNYSPTPLLPKSVLAAVDVQNDSPENMQLNAKILEYAAYFASIEGAKLHVVQAWEMYGEAYLLQHRGIDETTALRKQYEQQVGDALDRLMTPLKEQGTKFQLHLANGSPDQLIPELAHAHNIALLVMGTVGRTGISGHIMGNTAESVLRKVSCSLLALKPDGFVSPVN